jgi:hypothetical protein
MFRHGKSRLVYLEFVHFGKGGEPINKPVVSVRCGGPLKKYFNSIKARKGIQAKYIHKNYTWKKVSKSALPGWNFVTFARPAFKNLYPWFTEYEPNPGKKRVPPPPHPNTAQAIAGIELVVRAEDRPKLQKVFGKSFTGEEVHLGGIRLFLVPGKATRIAAVIIDCKSLKRFMKHAKIRSKVSWRGQDAALIKNPARGMWDIHIKQA